MYLFEDDEPGRDTVDNEIGNWFQFLTSPQGLPTMRDTTRDQIIRVMPMGQAMTSQEVADAAGHQEAWAHLYVNELVQEELIRKYKDGRRMFYVREKDKPSSTPPPAAPPTDTPVLPRADVPTEDPADVKPAEDVPKEDNDDLTLEEMRVFFASEDEASIREYFGKMEDGAQKAAFKTIATAFREIRGERIRVRNITNAFNALTMLGIGIAGQ